MVHSIKLVLNVSSCAHFLRWTQNNTYFSVSYFVKKTFLVLRFFIIVNKSDFIFRDSVSDKLGFYIIIQIKSVFLRRGIITENNLSETFVRCLFPDIGNIVYAHIDLSVGFIRKQRIYKSLIETDFNTVGGNLKHIVNIGRDLLVVNLFRTFRQGLY